MRTLVALLLLANLGFLALSQGWLQPYVGLSTQHEREPQRLAAQIDAQSVRVLSTGPAASAPAPTCLQAGPFGLEQIEALETALEPALHAPTRWQRQPVEGSAQPQYWLRVEQPAAALRLQLEDRVAATAGASLEACPPPR
jgi:hypothetical protein